MRCGCLEAVRSNVDQVLGPCILFCGSIHILLGQIFDGSRLLSIAFLFTGIHHAVALDESCCNCRHNLRLMRHISREVSGARHRNHITLRVVFQTLKLLSVFKCFTERIHLVLS